MLAPELPPGRSEAALAGSEGAIDDARDAAVRASLEALSDYVAAILRRYSKEALASITGYAYLVDAVNSLQL